MNHIASKVAIGLLTLAVMIACGNPAWAQTTQQHELLKKFEGKWDAKIELNSKDQTEPIKINGIEKNVMLGEYWMVSDLSINPGDETPIDFRKWTIGYSPKEAKFHGFFANVASPYHETQSGQFDKTTNTLTLMTDYRNQQTGEPVRGKRVIEFLNVDQRRLTLFQKNDAGNFEQIAKVDFSRIKK